MLLDGLQFQFLVSWDVVILKAIQMILVLNIDFYSISNIWWKLTLHLNVLYIFLRRIFPKLGFFLSFQFYSFKSIESLVPKLDFLLLLVLNKSLNVSYFRNINIDIWSYRALIPCGNIWIYSKSLFKISIQLIGLHCGSEPRFILRWLSLKAVIVKYLVLYYYLRLLQLPAFKSFLHI